MCRIFHDWVIVAQSNNSFYFALMNSMNEIIDKYSTHSKNLGKSHPQPSLDLNVCQFKLSFFLC
jgi:hypothetical protein